MRARCFRSNRAATSRSRSRSDTPTASCGPSVDDPCGRLEIDVQVTLRTSSGAFDETVDGVLMASSPFEARLVLDFHTTVVQPYAPPAHEDAPVVPVHPLAGALDVTVTNDGGHHKLAFLELVFTFSELGFNGYADGWIYGVDDGSLRLAPLLATIGETCDGGYGFPLGPEEPPVPDAMSPSARDVLALLAEMRIDAVRDDGARSPLSLSLEYVADSACRLATSTTSWRSSPYRHRTREHSCRSLASRRREPAIRIRSTCSRAWSRQHASLHGSVQRRLVTRATAPRRRVRCAAKEG